MHNYIIKVHITSLFV